MFSLHYDLTKFEFLLNYLFIFGCETGKNFLTWNGPKAQLIITESEFAKEILKNKEKAYPQMEFEDYLKKLLGSSLVTSEGEKWSKLRKLANHALHAESLKVRLY